MGAITTARDASLAHKRVDSAIEYFNDLARKFARANHQGFDLNCSVGFGREVVRVSYKMRGKYCLGAVGVKFTLAFDYQSRYALEHSYGAIKRDGMPKSGTVKKGLVLRLPFADRIRSGEVSASSDHGEKDVFKARISEDGLVTGLTLNLESPLQREYFEFINKEVGGRDHAPVPIQKALDAAFYLANLPDERLERLGQ